MPNMSCSQSSTGSLLRRPRPPPAPTSIPAITSQRSLDTNMSNHSRITPATRRMPSLTSHQDGLQSPVPTMQSGYDPVFQSQKSKLQKGRTQNNESDDNTTAGDTGDTLSKKGLVLPYKPRGPDPFPMREPKRPPDVKREYILPDDHARVTPEFTLLQQELMNDQTSVKTVDVSQQAEIVTQQRRVPKTQLIVQMKSIVQDRLRQLGLTSPGKFDNRKTDVDQLWEEIQHIGDSEGVGRKSQLALFNKATSAVFQAHHKRPGSAFDGENTESIITPSELSILNCLMEGGYVLSLKAHFIPQLPELSPLSTTLVYLNLSFNEFVEFPREVLFCRDLQVLKLRNNPLKEVPQDISKLKKLRTLILSFCCLTALPVSVFTLTRLEFFDVSFNKLTSLASEIKNLEKLRFLNVEGNELTGLPCGLLKLNLFRIRVRNNYMNPLFWKESSKNDPQRLVDLCLLTLKTKVTKDDPDKMMDFPHDVFRAINSFKPCDCCSGPRFGPGLKIIRPCTEIWGMRRLPFIFQSCSPPCYSDFIHNTDPKISELIYGLPEDRSPPPVDKETNADQLGTPPSPREGAVTA